MYHLVVFDWEGTIRDSYGHLWHILKQQAEELGLPPFSKEPALPYLNAGIKIFLKKLFPTLSPEQLQLLQEHVQAATPHVAPQVFLVDGVTDLIQTLHAQGILLAIATNKNFQNLQRDLDITQLQPYFSCIRTAGQTQPKPNPQMLSEIMQFYHVAPEKTLMIGDTNTDLEMAHAARVSSLGIDIYYENLNSLLNAKPCAVFHDYPSLSQWLLPKIQGTPAHE
ncbi:MAG: HAD-IA family hydrolase [Legionellaceae bacterium]|nr:HAD-IA family hydrolase [Legionellaceae bacterium]